MPVYKLLSVESDPKTSKSIKFGYLTGILYLAPAEEAGGWNFCPSASEACKTHCLYNTGRAGFIPKIKQARMRKSQLFLNNRAEFLTQLNNDILMLISEASKRGLKPAIRLNGTSDIPWEKYIDMAFYKCQFYDYTKIWKRYINMDLPKNYHLTYSIDSSNRNHHLDQTAFGSYLPIFKNRTYSLIYKYITYYNFGFIKQISAGKILPNSNNVAHCSASDRIAVSNVVFWPESSVSFLDGDEHDLTFLRNDGDVLLLKFKGKTVYEYNIELHLNNKEMELKEWPPKRN